MIAQRNSPISSREGEVVQHLWRLRFLTAAQIADFLFGGSDLGRRSRIVINRRVLSALKRRGIITTLPRSALRPAASEAPPVYCLTTEGLGVARALWPERSGKRSSPPTAFLCRHALATADVILAFQRGARECIDHELVAWECDWQAALRFGSTIVTPDAYLLYRISERRLHAFVEVDMATEHTRLIAAKLRAYLELYRTGTWQRRLPVWPLVLLVAASPSRAIQLRRICEAVAAVPGDQWVVGAESFRFAALADVTAGPGPLRAIWRIAGSNAPVSLVPDREPATAPEGA